jgi:hypothetical protein
MTDNKGNKWAETEYEGYGIFGGKDYYELLAEMNGQGSDRDKGIDLSLSEDSKVTHPNLTEDPNWEWRNQRPEDCNYQGFFYPEDETTDYWEC